MDAKGTPVRLPFPPHAMPGIIFRVHTGPTPQQLLAAERHKAVPWPQEDTDVTSPPTELPEESQTAPPPYVQEPLNIPCLPSEHSENETSPAFERGGTATSSHTEENTHVPAVPIRNFESEALPSPPRLGNVPSAGADHLKGVPHLALDEPEIGDPQRSDPGTCKTIKPPQNETPPSPLPEMPELDDPMLSEQYASKEPLAPEAPPMRPLVRIPQVQDRPVVVRSSAAMPSQSIEKEEDCLPPSRETDEGIAGIVEKMVEEECIAEESVADVADQGMVSRSVQEHGAITSGSTSSPRPQAAEEASVPISENGGSRLSATDHKAKKARKRAKRKAKDIAKKNATLAEAEANASTDNQPPAEIMSQLKGIPEPQTFGRDEAAEMLILLKNGAMPQQDLVEKSRQGKKEGKMPSGNKTHGDNDSSGPKSVKARAPASQTPAANSEMADKIRLAIANGHTPLMHLVEELRDKRSSLQTPQALVDDHLSVSSSLQTSGRAPKPDLGPGQEWGRLLPSLERTPILTHQAIGSEHFLASSSSQSPRSAREPGPCPGSGWDGQSPALKHGAVVRGRKDTQLFSRLQASLNGAVANQNGFGANQDYKREVREQQSRASKLPALHEAIGKGLKSDLSAVQKAIGKGLMSNSAPSSLAPASRPESFASGETIAIRTSTDTAHKLPVRLASFQPDKFDNHIKKVVESDTKASQERVLSRPKLP